MHILLIEDDLSLVEEVSLILREADYQVSTAGGQQEALTLLYEKTFDLILLDISLPDGNGFSLCSAIKAEYEVPVIFLSALSDEYSTVTGLELGAEDYISKPFRSRELLARINSVMRRHHSSSSISIGDLVLNTQKAKLTRENQEIPLSALEYRLLLIFANHPGKMLSRDYLVEEIFAITGEYILDNTLTVYIKRLREKIEEDPTKPKHLLTIRGLG